MVKRESCIVYYVFFISEACWYLSAFLVLTWKAEKGIFASSEKQPPPNNPDYMVVSGTFQFSENYLT